MAYHIKVHTEISAGCYAQISAIWIACQVANPARGDTYEAVIHTLANGGRMLIAYESELMIGTLWLTHDFRRTYIHHMAVMPDYQNRGIGKLLMQRALEISTELGYQAKLEVHTDNPSARKLYENEGFTYLDGYLLMINRHIKSRF